VNLVADSRENVTERCNKKKKNTAEEADKPLAAFISDMTLIKSQIDKWKPLKHARNREKHKSKKIKKKQKKKIGISYIFVSGDLSVNKMSDTQTKGAVQT
jgi:hypothetical protein